MCRDVKVLTAMQRLMLDAKDNLNPDLWESFDELMERFATSACEMDQDGDVWQYTAESWWDDRGKSKFLEWLSTL